ncbi:oligosaccharide flippase family protein [Halalkalibacter kiskunsagensis]|uniref:Oligosaccharide flippase family protein n=1 Tax=Halalkalibacter kiskunsagensis TaxID=1548599 RepID=A0ABV6KI09_9BACI
MKNRGVLQGIAVLSAAALLAKILSAAYRIPYQNLSGDMGYYVYQQIYPLYGIIMVLSMYGFPVVLSKRRSELLASGRVNEARNVTSLLFYGLLLIVTFLWLGLFMLAPYIAQLMADEQLAGPIRAMSFVVFLLPFLSVGRGHHQGEGELVSTAVSHIVEQLVRVLFILGFTYLFVTLGFDAYKIGVAAAYGSFIGGVIGVIALLLLTRAVWIRQLVHPKKLQLAKVLNENIGMIRQSIFICLSALIFVLLQLIDAFTIVRFLQWSGVPASEAFPTKGIYDRGQPLVQLGTVLTTTLSLALVPMLSKAVATKKVMAANHYQTLSYRLTLLIGGAATIGLIIIIEPTNHMLFTDTLGTDVLRVMSIAILFSSFFVTASAVLQGYNLAFLPAIAVGIGVILKLILNSMFVPILGTIGAAWATVIAVFVMVVYLLLALKRKNHLFIGNYKSYLQIVMVLILMGVVTWLWKEGVTTILHLHTRATDSIIALSSALVGGIVVVGCLFTFSLFTEEEWSKIPKLNKLRVRLMKRRG